MFSIGLLTVTPSAATVALLVAVLAGYTVYGAIWRLYLSPIAQFPGPRFAALTFWNEFYYDVVLSGRYGWKIREYHKKYGPIVRINPYEVHINDPDFYEVLNIGRGKGKVDKWWWSVRTFGQLNASAFDTTDHDRHRRKREPWNPYFSKQSVTRLQSLIQALVDKLCDRLSEHKAAGKPVLMTYAYASLTADVISEYTFPEGYNLLDKPEFDTEQLDAWIALSSQGHLIKQCGWLIPLFNTMPLWMTKIISPATYISLNLKKKLMKHAVDIIERRDQLDTKQTTSRPSLIHSFLNSELPEYEKTPDILAGESQTAIGAGTTTTTHALTTATYHILANSSVLQTLVTDLSRAIPNPINSPSLKDLEQIPYLVAVMYETLRYFHGVSHRLQRIFPDRPLKFREWSIPAGTPMSMTSMLIHTNPEIFPEPYAFKPERWVPLQTNGQRQQRYLLSFSKGTRACVRMELAKAEILMTLACVFRRCGSSMRLYDTIKERDVDVTHDHFIAATSKGSHGLMVFLEKEKD